MNTPSSLAHLITSVYTFSSPHMTFTKLYGGVENDTYQVKNENKQFILRIYNQKHSIRGERSESSINQELLFMQKASEYGIPVPSIVSTKSGELFGRGKLDAVTIFIALFTFIKGESPTMITVPVADEMGRAVARLFSVGKFFHTNEEVGEFSLVHRVFTNASSLKTTIHALPESLQDALSHLYFSLQSEHASFLQRKLSTGLVHGDIKVENLLFSKGDRLVSVLDFDDYRYSYLIEEACMALMHNFHDTNKNIIRAGHYEVFMKAITNTDLQKELSIGLPFLLKARFLYDCLKYLKKEKVLLVEELWKDPFVTQYILSAK